MRKGEKWILAIIGIAVIGFGVRNFLNVTQSGFHESIPFYFDAEKSLQKEGALLYKRLKCKNCHTLWTVRNTMQNVPAPALDGIGSLRGKEWLYRYFSAESPQSIIPSRLKKEYQMPSFAHLPEQERRILASYMANLKVKSYFLEQTKMREFEKRTGKPPYFSIASRELVSRGKGVYDRHGCHQCHQLWTKNNKIRRAAGVGLNAVGSRRSNTWLKEFLAGGHPGDGRPRLQAEEIDILTQYLASLKGDKVFLEELSAIRTGSKK